MKSIFSLNGEWDIYIDEKNKKLDDLRYCDIKDSDLWRKAQVPGCWDILIDSKVFEGPVWFRKEWYIPHLNNPNNRWILKFDAVSYYCEIFINDLRLGCHEGMWDNFSLDITDSINAGEMNCICLKAYKQGYEATDKFPFRQTLAGFIPDVLCTFGGIWGNVTLEEKAEIYVENIFVETDIFKCKVKVHMHLKNKSAKDREFVMRAAVSTDCGEIAVKSNNFRLKKEEDRDDIMDIKIENPVLWELENPFLYTVEIRLIMDGDDVDIKTKRFGMREIKSQGRSILLNGKPIYIRGVLHWGCYPETIQPNVGKAVIREEIKKIKEFGFNAVKHCLYIPREDYFDLADEIGILTWLELPLWLPEVTDKLKSRIEFEYPGIIKQVAGHPSLTMYSLGCELNSDIDSSLLEKMYHLAKDSAGNLLVRDNSGSGECFGGLTVDYADFYDYHFYSDLHNLENLVEVFTPEWREVRPWLFGEFCDVDTYRDIRKLKDSATGKNLWWTGKDSVKNPVSSVKSDFYCDILEERMLENGLAEETEILEKLSINHAMVHRKFTLEMTRRFSAISGYIVTAMRDIPIATSGIFDDFGNPKFNSKKFKKFNNEIVLSPTWNLKRTWINGDRVLNRDRFNYWCGDLIGWHVIGSNYSSKVLKNIEITWSAMKDNGEVVAQAHSKLNRNIGIGCVEEIAFVNFSAPEVEAPTGITITACLQHQSGVVENSWRIWIYPKNLKDTSEDEILLFDVHGTLEPLKSIYNMQTIDENYQITSGIVLATHISPNIERYLKQGGKVFYIQRGIGYLPSVKTSFWRESFCRYYEHKIIDKLVKDDDRDLQFFGLAPESAIDTFNIKCKDIRNITPIIRRVDSRQYLVSDYLVEMQVGEGTLIATTLQVEGGMGKQPNSLSYNNLGIYLIDQIIKYLLMR